MESKLNTVDISENFENQLDINKISQSQLQLQSQSEDAIKLNNHPDINNTILSYVEHSLKNQKIKDNNFIKNHLLSLVNNYGKENFLKILKNRLEKKKLIFLRHVQAEHNEYNIYHRSKGIEKPKFFDPKVTQEGISQSEEIKEFLKNLNFKIEIVFSSPLRRTLQTVDLIKGAFHDKNIPVIVTELLREEVTNPDTHFGHHLSKMKEAFKEMEFLNYDYMLKEHWWSYDHDHEYKHVEHKHLLKPEKKNHFKARLAMFLIWFIFREEIYGCVVSHSKVFKELHFAPEGSKRAKHGGYYIIENDVLFEYIEKFLENNLKNEKIGKYGIFAKSEKNGKNYVSSKSKSSKNNNYSTDYYFEAALKK
jgi:broad specificity phosphatase PhoE